MRIYIRLANGLRDWFQAISSSSGAADANKAIVTNSKGKVDITFMPDGIGPDEIDVQLSETVAAGHYGNIWNDGGTIKARLADGPTGRVAIGFFKAAGNNGDTVRMRRLEGVNSNVSGRTVGDGVTGMVWLGASGVGTQTAPTPATGAIDQVLGRAISATEDAFIYQEPVTFS